MQCNAMLCILTQYISGISSNQLTQTTYVRLQRATLKREGIEKWEKENFADINLFVTSKKQNHEFTNSRI